MNSLNGTNLLLMGILTSMIYTEPINYISGFLYLVLACINILIHELTNKKKNGE
jgi:hypothetical protein